MAEMVVKPYGVDETVVTLPVVFEQSFHEFLRLGCCACPVYKTWMDFWGQRSNHGCDFGGQV